MAAVSSSARSLSSPDRHRYASRTRCAFHAENIEQLRLYGWPKSAISGSRGCAISSPGAAAERSHQLVNRTGADGWVPCSPPSARPSFPNSNARLFHYPELAIERGAGQDLEQPPRRSQDVVARLAVQPEYDKPRIRMGRVRSDVREIRVERDDDAALAEATEARSESRAPTRSWSSTVTASCPASRNYFRKIDRQVLVELEPHAEFPKAATRPPVRWPTLRHRRSPLGRRRPRPMGNSG